MSSCASPIWLSASYALLAKAKALRYDYLFGTPTGEAADYDVDVNAIIALDP